MRQQQVMFKAYSDAAAAQQIVDALRVGCVLSAAGFKMLMSPGWQFFASVFFLKQQFCVSKNRHRWNLSLVNFACHKNLFAPGNKSVLETTVLTLTFPRNEIKLHPRRREGGKKTGAEHMKTVCIFLTCYNCPVSWPGIIFSVEQCQICLNGTRSDKARGVRPFEQEPGQQIEPSLTLYFETLLPMPPYFG